MENENILKRELYDLFRKSKNSYELIRKLNTYFKTIKNKNLVLDLLEFNVIEKDITYYKNYHLHDPFAGTAISGHGNKLGLYENALKWVKKEREKIEKEVQGTTTLDLSNTKENFLKFNLTPIELIELVKALYENGNIKGTQKEAINQFSAFFNIEVNHPDKKIQDLKIRKNNNETIFLDKLKTSLIDYLQK